MRSSQRFTVVALLIFGPGKIGWQTTSSPRFIIFRRTATPFACSEHGPLRHLIRLPREEYLEQALAAVDDWLGFVGANIQHLFR
jgi:hypothetical protein